MSQSVTGPGTFGVAPNKLLALCRDGNAVVTLLRPVKALVVHCAKLSVSRRIHCRAKRLESATIGSAQCPDQTPEVEMDGASRDQRVQNLGGIGSAGTHVVYRLRPARAPKHCAHTD